MRGGGLGGCVGENEVLSGVRRIISEDTMFPLSIRSSEEKPSVSIESGRRRKMAGMSLNVSTAPISPEGV